MRKLIPILALLAFIALPAHAYTAYPSLAAGGSNSGLTSGSVIGYTVLGTNGTTVIAARTTAGIVELGNGSYAVPAGISVPDGSTYYVKWDRSDTSTILGAAPTSASSYAYTLQTSIAALPSADATAVWAAGSRTITGGTITAYTGNTPQTGDAFARLGGPAGASLAADIAAIMAKFPNRSNLLAIDGSGRVTTANPSAVFHIGP